jgi:[acyl-carrier-protein] S-malonyltransferase
MMAAFEALPAVRATFTEASEILGQDLWALVSDGPAEELNRTVNTQPVMLAAGIALWRAWTQAGGPRPDFAAGHSLGEYTALVAAESLAFSDALPLVRLRAQAMQHAVPEGSGAIAAILGLDDDAVRAVCKEAAQGEVLEAANYNAPAQVVIAGQRSAVERGMELAKARGAKRAVALPMSVPSHCSLMRQAAEQLRVQLAPIKVQAPRIPLLSNADVAQPADGDAVRDSLARQLYSPVRWVETVAALTRAGVTRIVECGPGGVLSALNKRIAPQAQSIALKDAEQLGLTARGA